MLSEYFLDVCLDACCSNLEKYNQKNELFDSIHTVLTWYKKETKKDGIPLEFKDKIDITYYLSMYRKSHKNFKFQKMIESISNGRLKDMIPVLEEKYDKITDEHLENISKMIINRRKLCSMLSGKLELQKVLMDIDSGNYVDDSEIIDRWEENVNKLYNNVSEVKKIESVDRVISLDLLNDDYDPVVTKIRRTLSNEEVLKSGFELLDNSLPCKGFEERRFYLIGGTSGVGKSTFLVNLICNAVQNNKKSESSKKDVYVYFTAENLVDETLLRIYSCLTKESNTSVIQKILFDPTFDMKKNIIKHIQNCNANIIIKYVQPKRTTIPEIEMMVDVISRDNNIKGVYIDYLDLFRSGMNLADTRLELGEVALGLKLMAVTYSVPVVTVTQLNRSGYDPNSEPTLISMSESMQKIDHSDFVLYIQNAKEPKIAIPDGTVTKYCKKIKMTILKNRGGKVGNTWHSIMVENIDGVDVFNFTFEDIPRLKDTEFIGGNKNQDDSDGTTLWSAF